MDYWLFYPTYYRVMELSSKEQKVVDWVIKNQETMTAAGNHFGITYHHVEHIFDKLSFIANKALEERYNRMMPKAKEFKASYKDLIIPSDTSLTVGDYIKYYK